jgi:hypothetical protein
VEQLFRFALALGERPARALDVGPRAGVSPVEKQHARPDVNRLLVPPREILVEPVEEQLLDAGVALGVGPAPSAGGSVNGRVGHDAVAVIIRQRRGTVNRTRRDRGARAGLL